MSKQPYIPLYIGDWEQDTNGLTLLAEGALLKLVFKLFKSEKKGVFVANYKTLSVLFKSDLATTKDILKELIDNKVLNIGEIEYDKIEIISRRMMREANISAIRSDVKKQNPNKTPTKPSKKGKKQATKPQQNAEYDIEYIIELLNKKGGKNFSSKTSKTKEFIRARLNEGFTNDDFERVINFKCDEWMDDEKMSKFIRPETLFGSKFEGYLQSVPKTKNKTENTISEADYAKP